MFFLNFWREYCQGWKRFRWLAMSFSSDFFFFLNKNLKTWHFHSCFLSTKERRWQLFPLGDFFAVCWGRGREIVSLKKAYSQLKSCKEQDFTQRSVPAILETQVDVAMLIQHSSWFQAFLYSQEHWKLTSMFEMKTDMLIWLYDPNNLECVCLILLSSWTMSAQHFWLESIRQIYLPVLSEVKDISTKSDKTLQINLSLGWIPISKVQPENDLRKLWATEKDSFL